MPPEHEDDEDGGHEADRRVKRPCIRCGAASNATAELLLQTDLWDFYYCPNCRHWFQVSANDPRLMYPVRRKGHERALNLLYAEKMQQLQSLYNTSDQLERLRRRLTFLFARLYLKVSRLNR